MDTQTLRSKIEHLDPATHLALREALMAQYTKRIGESGSGGRNALQAFDGMFKVIAGEIAERYVRGTSEYVRKHHPDLYRRTEDAHKRLDEVWRAGRMGSGGLCEFRAALREWQRLHFDQIETYIREVQARKDDSMCGAS